MNVTGGGTNVTTYFMMRLTATGRAATGLTIATFDLQYTRTGVAPAAKVDAAGTLAAAGTAHTDNYMFEVDSTSSPGLYRVDWPDAAFAAGVPQVHLSLKYDSTVFTEVLAVDIDAPVNTTKVSGTAQTALDINDILADTAELNGTKVPQTLNLTALGNIGIDWENVENNATAVDLAFTTVSTISGNVDGSVGSVLGGLNTTAGTITTLDALDTEQDTQHTTTQGRLPAALSSGNMKCDALAISGSATAADKLEASAETIINGTITTGTSETEFADSSLSAGLDDNHYNGRVVIFLDNALIKQATDITDFVAATGTFTVTALTVTPSIGDTFIIV